MAKYIKVFLFFLTVTMHAQYTNLKFDKIGPIVIPNCVLQDSYGFTWIGAQEGLIKYDGYDFERYTQVPFDSTSLSNNFKYPASISSQ